MIVVGTTLSAMAMSDDDAWRGWLLNARELREQTPEDVHFFAAIETDRRGIRPFGPLIIELDRLAREGGDSLGRRWPGNWTFSLDDLRTAVTFDNRLRHITLGQNIVRDFALSHGASHLLFMAADCAYEPDGLQRLLDLRVAMVGGHVSTYCLDGPIASRFIPDYGNQIREHMPSMAYCLIRRDLLQRVPFRWDGDAGMSDDPAYAFDAEALGHTPYVHHGVLGRHYPECIGDYESRGYDTEVIR